MTPADYLRLIVLPTLREFLDAPEDQRRPYLACITAAHLVDHMTRGGRYRPKAVREGLASVSPHIACCLEIVEGICNGTKHAGPGREAAFPFLPGHERYVPAFGLDMPHAGLDESRWDKPGLVVAHRIADRSPGLASYFIDDCVCALVRAYATVFPLLLGTVDLDMVAPELDRMAWVSAAMVAMSKIAP